MNKITLKKWTRTEWLLLLAPLVIVIGIGAMNFAPQLILQLRLWREYGSNKPFAILHLQSTGEKQSEPSFGSFAFSPDGQQIAISETLINNTSFGNPTRVWLWRSGEEKPFSSWLFLQSKNSRSQVTQLCYLDDKTISASIALINYGGRELTGASFEEKRDARNGRLMARKTVKINLEEERPSEIEFLMDQGSSTVRSQKLFWKCLDERVN